MSAQQTVSYFWLPDDTEEDLVGADWHQRAIDIAFDALNDVSELAGLPWHVGNQLTLVGWTPGGSWRPSPDIMVHPTAGPEPRKEMAVATDGPPVLVIEVASPTTWQKDVNIVDGKAAGYMGLGIEYYLVFDPNEDLLGVSCRGWHLSGGTVREWRAEPDGSYRVTSLGIALRPEGGFLRVIDQAGRQVPTRSERLQALLDRTRESATLRQELAAQEQQQATLQEELAAWERRNAAQAREIEALRVELERLRAGGIRPSSRA